MSYVIPKDLRYSKTHEWVKDLGGNRYRIGITDYASKHIGDVTYVGLPATGIELGREESACAIETVKASEEVFNPVAGTVVVENEAVLGDAPETVNNECYDEGWLYEVKAASADDFKALMDAAAYEKFLAELGD